MLLYLSEETLSVGVGVTVKGVRKPPIEGVSTGVMDGVSVKK